MTLTIVLLAMIVFASILGTLIPQRDAAARLASDLPPGLLSVLQTLQVFDIFHSAWFILLLILLLINLIVCSINRFPSAWRRFKQASQPAVQEDFDRRSFNNVVHAASAGEDLAVAVETFLKKKYRKGQRLQTGKTVCLYAAKGALSTFGVYVVHVSVLLILSGVILGSLFGFDGHLELAEGESSDHIILKGGRGTRHLDFAVRCDRFILEHYPDGTPKTYRSDIAFLKDGSVAKSGALLVNHPLTFEGIRFYQSSYGEATGGKNRLIIRKDRDKIADVDPVIGEEVALSEGKALMKVIRVEKDFMGMGPAVKITIKRSDDDLQIWIFQAIERMVVENPGLLDRAPMFNPGLFAPYSFSLDPVGSGFYTGLQVDYDPGLYIVGTGAFSLVIGFLWVFFYDYRQIWVKIEQQGAKTTVSMAGWSNKSHAGLDRDIARLRDQIKSMGGER